MGEREWLYASTFAFDVNARGEYVELVFEGLDTFCTVYLVCYFDLQSCKIISKHWQNEEVILDADNQFRTYRASTPLLCSVSLFSLLV